MLFDEAKAKSAKDSSDGKKLPPWLQGKAPKTGAKASGSSKTTSKNAKMGKNPKMKGGKC